MVTIRRTWGCRRNCLISPAGGGSVAVHDGTLGRNLDQDRPHLGPGLIWLPAEQRSRLSSVAKLLVPYRADTTVERGGRVTQEVLRATSELARAHGATPLLVVLQFGHEEQPEQMLRRRILDNADIPYVFVDIDSSWRLPSDRHPTEMDSSSTSCHVQERCEASPR